MKLTSEGHRYFGRAVETLNFKNIHLKEKVTNWIREHQNPKLLTVQVLSTKLPSL